MSSPAVQLSFTLRTSPNVRTVHLLGSWDNYKSQLPLSISKDGSAKPGSWKGTFRFQGSHSLQLGSRYWYYYIVDGYHVSHDPAKESVTEKTTGRKLNILDIPGPKAESRSSRPVIGVQTNLPTKNSRHSREIPTGRPLTPTKIFHPKPSKPYASLGLRQADYDTSPIEQLEERFEATKISDLGRRYASSPSELSDSSCSSGTVFSESASPSSPSSASSRSGSFGVCKCERYGVTRDGRRVKLDCGGGRCGYSSSESECSSSEEESEEDSSEDEREVRARMRREAERRQAPKQVVKGRSGGQETGRKAVAATRRR